MIRRQKLLRFAAASCLAILLIGSIVVWTVAGLLVSPYPQPIGPPPADLPASSFTVDSDSGSKIAGWHHRVSSSRGVVVVVHGIGGSRLACVDRSRMLAESDYSSILIDLRGHGGSPGEAVTMGALERHDVSAAVQYAKQQHPGESVGVIGVSLGGAAAVLGSPLGVDAMVIESVFPDIRDAVRNRVQPFAGRLAGIPTWLLLAQLRPRLGVSTSDLRPIEAITEAGCPILVASGSADVHTTAAETKRLYAAAPEPKELWLVDDAAHVDLLAFDGEAYRERVIGFLNQHLRRDTD